MTGQPRTWAIGGEESKVDQNSLALLIAILGTIFVMGVRITALAAHFVLATARARHQPSGSRRRWGGKACWPRFSTIFVAGLAVLLHASSPQGLAQEAPDGFDSLSVGISAVANVNRNTFHNFWSPDPGAELVLETPFYFGRVQAGALYMYFDAREPEQPDFRALYPFLGWGIQLPLPLSLDWYNGVRLGSYLITFDTIRGNRVERELGLGLNSRLGLRLGGAWAIDFSATYSVIFTHERIHLVYLAAGVRRFFRMPAWLREFLD